MKTHTYTLPTHWASAFINDDWSGITDDLEEEAMMQFLANEVRGYYCTGVSEDSSFVKYHDAADYGVLASDCSEFIFC